MKIYCPCCKSDYTASVEKRKGNGILGPGYRTWVVHSECVCLDCGVKFVPKSILEDMRKNAIKPINEQEVQVSDTTGDAQRTEP
jgi:hypothetical protein